MIRNTFSLVLLLICYTASGQNKHATNGSVVAEVLQSTILRDNKVGVNVDRTVKIYLPASYASTQRRYPVVYFCHNIFWSPEQMIEEGKAVPLLDRGMSNGVTREFIMVIANYRGEGFGSLYENSTTTGRWLDFTVEELVPFIDGKFRTIRDSDSRAVVGDFFGGRGALKLGMTYPNIFGTVYALHPVAAGNGSLPWAVLNVDWKKLNTAKTIADLAGNDRTGIFMAIHQAFLPNPNRPPFYCDFSYEMKNGELSLVTANMMATKKAFLLDEVLEESADNLRKLRGIAFDWGRYDLTTAHIESNRLFSSKLEDLGITHTAEEYNGTQVSKLWTDDGRFYTRVLPFLNQHLVFEK